MTVLETCCFFCGKEGIRTLEALLTLTRFPGGPLQPLEHLSVGCFFNALEHRFCLKSECKSTTFFRISKKKCIFALKDFFDNNNKHSKNEEINDFIDGHLNARCSGM